MIINTFGISKAVGDVGFVQEEKLLLITILLILIPVLSFVAIFFFKKRKLQLRITFILLLLIAGSILILAFYAYKVMKSYNVEADPRLNLIIPLLTLLSTFLAYRGIKKDEEIVRSYDRLR